MRERFHILHLPVLPTIMAAALLTACSQDENGIQTAEGEVPADHVVHLQTFATGYEEAATTRSAPSGYINYPLDKVAEMGIYMYLAEDATALTEKRIRYDGTKWHAYFSVVKDKTYAVYGYLPRLDGVTSTLGKSTADAATLTITGMKPITPDDVCIITGVSETDEDLQEGNLSWKQDITGNDYHIYMLLNHLYASVSFRLTVNADYARLRTIKLKSMKLSTNKASVTATITLTHNTTGANPITNAEYSLTGSSSEAVFFNDTEGEALSATVAKEFDTCFAPSLSNELTLTSTYDVYDRKGNLIRKDCTATNKLPDFVAHRGVRMQMNLTVNPTYLYMLSDPDLDNPTITVN